MEKVEAGQSLYLINAADSLPHGLAAAVVLVDKADGCGILTGAKHHLIERLRYGDTATAVCRPIVLC